ncbi:MAG: 50S ribosomal protein L13 [Phycisphaerae bacterium]|nr:50S ribosomal protein L13 [Phycisphaerae bacterium]
MSTTLVKKEEAVPGWRIVDAEGKVLGRLATRVARTLMGKDKPSYTPSVDCGDYVVVVNASKIKTDWRSKWKTKLYAHYTSYPGGRKVVTFERMLEKHPERVIELAVRRMMPKTRLGKKMFLKLKVYPGAEHPHANHRPTPLETQ